MATKPLIWALCDDRPGNASQVRGVAESLGLPFLIQDLAYTAAAALPNYMVGASFGGLTRDARVNLGAPWPDLVIGAGRRTAPVARHIKALSDRPVFLVQIMFPGEPGIEDFDLVAVPRHDQMPKRDGFFEVTGAPHRLNPGNLAGAAHAWADRLSSLPGPRLALVVGGSTKRRRFTPEMGHDLGRRAAAEAARLGGSLMVTTSRRTGDAAPAVAEAVAGVPHRLFRWGDPGDNPYLGFLAVADAVIVTGDSVSMCSEACATGKPTYIFAPRAATVRKHGLLHDDLYAAGHARPLYGPIDLDWSHPPLNAADAVAEEIIRRMRLGGAAE